MNPIHKTAHRRRLSWTAFVLLLLCVAVRALCQDDATQATETETRPFPGVRYVRLEQPSPDPVVSHIVEIALDAPGLRFKTTASNGADAPRETWCESTREFVARVGGQIGINSNYFILDDEYHTDLLGLAVSEGAIVSPWDNGEASYALNITRDNRASFVERPENGAGAAETVPETSLYNAVSGRPMLLRNGDVLVSKGGNRHPRTAVGLTADNTLLLLVADGRQPAYSVGMTFHEMALLLRAYGAVDALALDGGGSATLVFADPEARVVNVPMPAELPLDMTLPSPGIERQNGNNLAIFVAPPPQDEDE